MGSLISDVKKGYFDDKEMAKIIQPTTKVRDFLSDSSVWITFRVLDGFREGDIIIAPYFKAGTTLTQCIVLQILHNGKFTQEKMAEISPWLDSSYGDHGKMIAYLKNMRERRVIKSHVPAHALYIDPKVNYIYVGRDGRNVALSFYNYLSHFTDRTMHKINGIYKKATGKNIDLVLPQTEQEFFDLWLENDGYNCGSFFDNVKSWWDLRHSPNVLLLHYDQLSKDLESELPRIATFLGISPETLDTNSIIMNCGFEAMKERAERLIPIGVKGSILDDPAKFFHKGTNRDYRKSLTPQQITKYETMVRKKLSDECSRWLTGYLNS